MAAILDLCRIDADPSQAETHADSAKEHLDRLKAIAPQDTDLPALLTRLEAARAKASALAKSPK